MKNMRSYLSRLCHAALPRCAAALLVVLAWGSLASCSRKHDATVSPDSDSVLSNTLKSNLPSTQEIKARTLIIVSNAQELRIGTIQTIEQGNGTFVSQSTPPDTVWVFRDFEGVSPDQTRSLQKLGIKTGKAYFKTNDGWKFIRDVDLKLTDEQIATQFGIRLPMPQEAEDAFLTGDLEKVKSLLKDNPDLVSSKTAIGATPLSLTVWRGHKDVAELLLANKADVNAKDDRGNTPLHGVAESDYMAENDRMAVAELLLTNGANVNATQSGETPLAMAEAKNRYDLAELLRQHGGYVIGTTIYDAASAGDLEKVKALLKDNPDMIFSRSVNMRQTPLFFATESGQKDVAELLLANGADVNARDIDGETPLFHTVEKGHIDAVQLLLASKADVNAKSRDGATPLIYAAVFNQNNIAQLLLANKAEVNAKDNGGDTPLHDAANLGYKDLVELLLANKAQVNAKDNNGRTPLAYATGQGPAHQEHKDVAELLRQHGGHE